MAVPASSRQPTAMTRSFSSPLQHMSQHYHHTCVRVARRGGCQTPEIHFPTTGRNAHRPHILPIVSSLNSFRNSKYIARRFHNGFLQVAVSKTLRRSGVLRPSKSSAPDRSRYSTKTYQAVAEPFINGVASGRIYPAVRSKCHQRALYVRVDRFRMARNPEVAARHRRLMQI
jgi:hypothetical protein